MFPLQLGICLSGDISFTDIYGYLRTLTDSYGVPAIPQPLYAVMGTGPFFPKEVSNHPDKRLHCRKGEKYMYTEIPTYGTFSDVLPGDPWQPEPAARYNAVNDLLRQENFMSPGTPYGTRGDSCCINVLNTSDKIIYFNRGVQIDSEFAGAEEQIDHANLHACGRPVEDEKGFWGLSLEEIEPGKSGMVQLTGVACLRNVWGEYRIPDPANPSRFLGRNDFVTAGRDGIFHLTTRGQARVIWHQLEQARAVVVLNCHSYFYDGMFTVLDNGNGTLTVRGGITDLPVTPYGNEINILEETIIPVRPRIYPTYVCLTGERKSDGGWKIAIESSVTANGTDLYTPGERIVWPLARYVDVNSFGHVRGLLQLHQGGEIHFRERYYVE